MSGETQTDDGGGGDAGDVAANHHACERREQKSLDQHHRRGGARDARAERLLSPADQPAGNEQRPAFDVARTREDAEHARRQDEPGGKLPDGPLHDADDEKRRASQLGEGQRGSPPDRYERQQPHRGQDHAHAVGLEGHFLVAGAPRPAPTRSPRKGKQRFLRHWTLTITRQQQFRCKKRRGHAVSAVSQRK